MTKGEQTKLKTQLELAMKELNKALEANTKLMAENRNLRKRVK